MFGDEQAPLEEYEWRVKRILLAKLTGWTLDYIDTLDFQTVNDVFVVLDEAEKVKAHQARMTK